jgi:hypothetical protein
MANITGPFTQTRLCGASITSIACSLGWNEQSSTVTVGLVEDVNAGDSFERPLPGTPVRLEFESLIFEGLVQRWLEKDGFDGKPVYEVVLTDPREILAGVQVILGSYRGVTRNVPNLINAFGYYEYIVGFGGALTNESGMVWSTPLSNLSVSTSSQGGSITINPPSGNLGIMPAIHAITNSGSQGDFGGPLQFMGYSYRVDLSGLPLPPSYYRIGGVAVSLLEAVSQLCQDSGCDYICYLDGDVIRFKTVSRLQQPVVGAIEAFIKKQKNVTSSSFGLELRNDITSSVLIGGDLISLNQIVNFNMDQTIWPYWGLDANNQVIVGQGKPEIGHTVQLNCLPIIDIMGSITYKVDIPELRFALADFDSWAAYVLKTDPDKAQTINLVSAIDSTSDLTEIFPDVVFQNDLIAENYEAIKQFGLMNESDYWVQRAQRVYEFVRTYAEEYFGRKFLVRLPFLIYWKYENETTHVVSSDEPADAGFIPGASMPLGLSFFNEDTFLAPDGRFECFVKFSNIKPTTVDLQRLPADAAVLQGNDTIYMKAQIDQSIGIVYPPGQFFPYVVVNLAAPLYGLAPDPLGGVHDIATVLGIPDESLVYAYALRNGSFPMRLHPAPYRPDAVAVPVKSNRDSYGPWVLQGAPGKVNFQRDEGLVPWNYGDFTTLDLVANAKLAESATNQQIIETGTLDIAGTPIASLGDELVNDGPTVTGIQVSIGVSGVTTSYSMQTYTKKFGAFARESADRMRRLGLAAQDMRRAVRVLFQQRAQMQQVVAAGIRGFMANTSRAVAQSTPHGVMLARVTKSDQYGYRTQVGTMTPQEAIANLRGDSPEYFKDTAMMTMEGVFRPFSTQVIGVSAPDPSGGTPTPTGMPHYEKMKGTQVDANPNRKSLDPLGSGNDIDYLAWGDVYHGVHQKKAAANNTPVHYDNTRAIGLRGPLEVVGWGFEYTGKPVPNSAAAADDSTKSYQLASTFVNNHRNRSELWKAGPVGLFWDNWRKIWTIPTFLFGTLDVSINNGGSGLMSITSSAANSDKVMVYESFGGLSTAFSVGAKVCAAYDQLDNKWRIIAGSCS